MTTAETQAIKARLYGIGWALVSHAQGTDKIKIIPAIRQGFDPTTETSCPNLWSTGTLPALSLPNGSMAVNCPPRLSGQV